MSPRARGPEDVCLHCATPLPHALVLVSVARRLPAGPCALVDPPLGTFCSRRCLARWAAAHDDAPPEAAGDAGRIGVRPAGAASSVTRAAVGA